MDKRDEFTLMFPDDMAYDQRSRTQKAKKMVAIIKDAVGDLSGLVCVDVGCSVGIITEYIANDFKKVIGVDVDTKAIKIAMKRTNSKNVSFKLSKENKLPLKDASIDVVIFSQIYEHAKNPQKLVDEIYRILKPGGVCFFGARNKYGGYYDGHYKLPFVSWLPKSISDMYVKVFTKKCEYDIDLYPLWKLNKLVKKFTKVDYTLATIKNPKKYKATDIIPTFLRINILIFTIFKVLYCCIPNYLWLLTKPKKVD